jgi:hypothetical protein
VHIERISEPEKLFRPMLRARNPLCPDQLLGVYCRCNDNTAETLARSAAWLAIGKTAKTPVSSS